MKSSLRPDHRYVLVKCHGPNLDEGKLRSEAMRWLMSYFGIEGMARVHPSIMRVDVGGQEMILRCRRGEEDSLIAGCALCAQMGGQKARLEVRRVSGTIAALIRKENATD